jgi:hypothetical protein
MLVGGQTLDTSTGADGVIIALPAAAPDRISSTIVLEVAGK